MLWGTEGVVFAFFVGRTWTLSLSSTRLSNANSPALPSRPPSMLSLHSRTCRFRLGLVLIISSESFGETSISIATGEGGVELEEGVLKGANDVEALISWKVEEEGGG